MVKLSNNAGMHKKKVPNKLANIGSQLQILDLLDLNVKAWYNVQFNVLDSSLVKFIKNLLKKIQNPS
jgi:hypothetical protein